MMIVGYNRLSIYLFTLLIDENDTNMKNMNENIIEYAIFGTKKAKVDEIVNIITDTKISTQGGISIGDIISNNIFDCRIEMSDDYPIQFFLCTYLAIQYDHELKISGAIFDGIKNGICIEYDDLGHIMTIEKYEKNIKNGESCWYDEYGNLTRKANFLDGKLHDEYIMFSQDNKIIQYSTYQHGFSHGDFLLFDCSGNVKTIGNYYHGLKDGKWYNYDNNNEIEYTEYYEKDILKRVVNNKRRKRNWKSWLCLEYLWSD